MTEKFSVEITIDVEKIPSTFLPDAEPRFRAQEWIFEKALGSSVVYDALIEDAVDEDDLPIGVGR